MKEIAILWTDDEIEVLKPYVLFLEEKGYKVKTATNGEDALKMVISEHFDIVFLDENMPGISGLETLNRIKFIFPNLPVVMITKSEEENIMEEAIGSKIADYLIKPVNPNQILLTLKKNIDTKRLIDEKTMTSYQSEFGKLSMEINSARSFNEWAEVYKKLVYWGIELDKSNDEGIKEILETQKTDANSFFAKFIQSNYTRWWQNEEERPLLSPSIMKEKVLPHVNKNNKVFFIVIDNLRYDQWRIIFPLIQDYMKIAEEDLYSSILPTSTQYARNAIFAGLMPLEIQKHYPDLWIDEADEDSKNKNEEILLQHQLKRMGQNIKWSYNKINNRKYGKKIVDNFSNLLNNDLSVLVYNFIDMLSHARTEMEMIRELANSDAAYRSLTLSWFQHSHLLDIIKMCSEKNIKVIITTDHGTIRVNNPVKVVGDRETSTNLRYKQGKNMSFNAKEVFEINKPEAVHLPRKNVSTSYIFASEDDFLCYPNNYNHFVSYYKNSFQHGGISLEEMMVPVITLDPK